jgi:hypothetical protein
MTYKHYGLMATGWQPKSGSIAIKPLYNWRPKVIKTSLVAIKCVATKILVAFGHQWNSWLVGNQNFLLANYIVFTWQPKTFNHL